MIGSGTTVTLAHTWTHSNLLCPSTYEVRRVLGGIDFPLAATELAVLTFDDSNGQLDILTSDTSLDNTVWTLKLFLRSTYSTDPMQDGVIEFDVTFQDGCWASTLTASVAPDPNVYDLY